MSLLNRKSALILGLLATLVAFGASAAPVFAWNNCALALSPSSQSTTVGTSTTTTFTYLLTYTDSSNYAASFTVTATASPGSPSGTWTIVSVTNPVPNSGKSDSISQIVSVVVKAPSNVGSTSTITVKAVGQQDSSSTCSATTRLTTVPPHTVSVPEFPAGMALLMALAVPALLLVRSKSKIIAA
jgi:hypothetical protein